MIPPTIPSSTPKISFDALKKHNRITSWYNSRDEKEIERFFNENTITLPPHPPVQLGDPIDWYADPLQQRNWCAQLHMFRWLDLLFYRIKDGDESAQKLCENLISSWVKSAFNPKPPRWAWKDMVDAVRTLWFLKAYEYVFPDYRNFLASVLYAHGEYLASPANLGHSNHATWQHQALLALGEVFCEQTWIDLALKRLEESFNTAFTDTYVNVENAPGYHAYNYGLWRRILRRLPTNSPETSVMLQKLEKIGSRIVYAVRPDGYLEELGDTSPQTDLTVLKGIPEADYILSQGEEGEQPQENTTIFETGFLFGRSGWGENARDFRDEFFYSLRFGERGVHGHNDLGSITMYSHGTPVLIDAGKYAYVVDAWRRYFNGRNAHNTLYIPGLEEEEEEAIYTIAKSHSDAFVDDVTVIGKPYNGVKHERRLIYVKGADALFTMDVMRSTQPRDCSVAWHFTPSAKVRTDDKKHFDIAIDEQHFRLIQLGSRCDEVCLMTEGQTTPYIQGYHSPAYNQKTPCPTLIQTRKNTRQTRIMNAIGHAANNILEVRPIPDTNIAFSIRTKNGYFIVDASQTPASVTFTREAPRAVSKATERIEDIYPAIIQNLNNSTSAYPQTVSKLQHRLSLITGVEGNTEEILTAAFTSPLLRATRDYGLRAALIDFIAIYDQKSVALVTQTSPLFRKPLFDSSFVEKKINAYDLLCESENRPFRALRIVDEHALYWQGMQGNSTLFVRFNGAIDRSRTQLPYCGGQTMHMRRSESWLIFSDPALDRDSSARISWYLGKTTDGTLYDEINRVVDGYVEEWGIERVIFLGSSGGGYAALQTGLRRGNCDVLSINPQTVLKDYPIKFYAAATDMARLNKEDDKELLNATLLLEHPAARSTSIHYVTNPQDSHHKTHFLPFKEAAIANKIPLEITELTMGKGHKALNTEDFNRLLDSLM